MLIIVRYPLHLLPELPLPSTRCNNTRALSEDEKTLLQCAYIWVHSYSEAPPSTTASYSELWFMLQYLQQLQCLISSLVDYFSPRVDAHRANYLAAAGDMMMPHYDYNFIRHYDFSHLKAVIANCAAFQHDLECLGDDFAAAVRVVE